MRLCACGCGQPVPINPATRTRANGFAGRSALYIDLHHPSQVAEIARRAKKPAAPPKAKKAKRAAKIRRS